MKLYDFKKFFYYGFGIKCHSREEADYLANKLKSMGFEWEDGINPYLNDTYWQHYNTAYFQIADGKIASVHVYRIPTVNFQHVDFGDNRI